MREADKEQQVSLVKESQPISIVILVDGRFRRIKLELSPSGKAKAGKVDIKTRDGYHTIRTALPPVVKINAKQ